MASGVGVMEKPIHQLQQQRQQQPLQSQEAGLKCPRCDSANTKFCYYNNYSLSQPRHFCKACKRYWTRGGTLRNVPVGGGCRKNKRVKRPPITTSTTTVHHVPVPPSAINHQTNPNPNHNQIPSSTTCTSSINSLFYGLLPPNPNYPRFNTPVSSISETGLVVSGYDHLLDQVLPARHINASGLGFSGTVLDVAAANHGHNSCSNLTSFSSYNNNNSPAAPMYGTGGGGSTSSSSSAPTTMASLLASSLNHQQQIRFMGGFASYDGSMVKDQLKIEQINRNMDEWNNNHHHHQMESAVDPNNSLLWDNNDEEGVWVDPTNNIGSTVPSLI